VPSVSSIGELWMLRIGEISTGRCDWRLTAERLREGDKRAVSLVLSLHLWQGEAPSEASNVIFSVPLDEEMLDQQRGTGQENANRKWVGQSAAAGREWSWSVHRES